MQSEPVTIAEFDHEYQAQMASKQLADNDIKSMIVGQALVANMMPIPQIRIELQVPADQAQQAIAILESARQGHEPAQEDS